MASHRRRVRPAWPWRLLGLAGVALFTAASLRPAFSHARERLSAAVAHRGESREEGRRRCLGAGFIDRVDHLRAELGPREPYYLVEGGDPKDGGALMVRFELAPRPAAFLGRFSRLAAASPLRRQIASRIHRVVVAFRPGQPPLDWQRFELLAAVARRDSTSAAGAGPPP
jgi:hypothetical protein